MLTTDRASTKIDDEEEVIITLPTAIAQDDGGEPLAELHRLAGLRTEIARAEEGQVRRARTAGYSWQAIASALGVSKQAAHRRFGRH